MRLEDCVLSADIVTAAPLVRDSPEEQWILARDTGAIPPALFDLYETAHYLSFGRAPGFLGDQDNILFSYFTMLLRCLMEALCDADDQLLQFTEAQNFVYDLGKKIRGEPWDPGADARAKKHFRDLLIALHTALDTLTELIALFFTGAIPRLQVGRAAFHSVEAWVKAPPPEETLIATPYAIHLRGLHQNLQSDVNPGPPEQDWLAFMRMLRNKAAHLGHPMFRQVGLHDKNRQFYVFLPRQWPFFWERHIRFHQPGTQVEKLDIEKHFGETLIHQDIYSFTKGARRKVGSIVSCSVPTIVAAYKDFSSFQPNIDAINELQKSYVEFKFESFAST